MKKHAFGAILISILWSSLAFITLAAGQPSKRIPTSPPHLPQQTTLPSPVTAAQFDPAAANASSSITTWNEPCANHRIDITGIGMGDTDTPINPQTFTLTDPSSVDWLLAQVAGRRLSGLSQLPDSVTFSTSAGEMMTLPTAASVTDQAYIFETQLQSAAQITALVNQPGNDLTLPTPRGLILYAQRAATERWTSVGKTMNQFVYWDVNPSQAETLDFPPLTQTTDLHITAVVIDNDIKDDVRPLVLEATAGGKVVNITVPGPTDGPLLNIVSLTLSQVPTGTGQAVVTLSSPEAQDGDSLVLVGVNVSYRCDPGEGTDLEVTKTVNRATPREGDIIAYTITIANNGPDDATGVQLSDVLPTGVTFEGYITTQGTYSSGSGLWIVNDLTKNTSATLIITTTVDSNTVGKTIVNTASHLIADQPDLISGNNESSVAINVISGTVTGIYLPIIFKDYCNSTYHIDQFDDVSSGWITGTYGEADYTYEPTPTPKEYRIFAKDGDLYPTAFSVSPFGPFNGYIVNVDVKWEEPPLGDEYGIIFGVQGNIDPILSTESVLLYRFVVNTREDNEYALRRYDGQRWHPVVGWVTDNTRIFSGTQQNTLQVMCGNSSASIFANGNLLWQGNLPAPCDGEIGLTSSSSFVSTDPKTDARFDNFEICGVSQLHHSSTERFRPTTLANDFEYPHN
jgi:uncharacterized repeat protein (TIGR01451 family)